VFLKKHTITKKETFFVLLLFSCFIVNETACTKLIKKESRPSEFESPIENEILVDKILAKNSERLKSFEDLKALAEISIHFPQKKIKRKNVILLRNDPAIRLEVLSISGKPFLYFTADSQHTTVYYPDRNTIFRGASSPENIARILGTNIELNNIVTFLSGNFNIPPQFQKIELYESKDFYLIKFLLKNNETSRVFVDKENYLPSQINSGNLDDDDTITIQYSDYIKINNYSLPFKINIKRPKKKQEITVKYKKALLNQGVSSESFTIPFFRGVKILPLEED
tara:strand:+ start:14142 stop:14987 length:846 start_codon:yes stop_codon:yes gene_type:complete